MARNSKQLAPRASGGKPPLDRDPGVPLILLARFLRGFADGFVSILLTRYLGSLGFSPLQIGAVVTGTLIGSAALTLGVGLGAGRRQLRHLLLAAAALMAATGISFALASAFGLVLAIGVIGTLNPTSGDVSVFLPTEQAYLAERTSAKTRPRTYGHYTLAGTLGAALGALASALPDPVSHMLHIRLLAAERSGFLLYATIALGLAYVYQRLPTDHHSLARGQHQPLRESRRTVVELAALFSLDSAGGGFATQSLLVLWLHLRFGLGPTTLAVIFFTASILAATSLLVAGPLAQRLGLVKTMVLTHLPADVMLALAALAPSAWLAVALLLGRSACSSMDVPARQSLVMALVPPEERMAAAGVTNVPRALATAATPILAGALLTISHAGWPLLIGGIMKITYDLTLWRLYRHVPERTGGRRTVDAPSREPEAGCPPLAEGHP
jgi:MFS family permease